MISSSVAKMLKIPEQNPFSGRVAKIKYSRKNMRIFFSIVKRSRRIHKDEMRPKIYFHILLNFLK